MYETISFYQKVGNKSQSYQAEQERRNLAVLDGHLGKTIPSPPPSPHYNPSKGHFVGGK